MIQTKEELRKYIYADRLAMGFDCRKSWKEWLKGNVEDVRIYQYIKSLRKYEYYFNNKSRNIFTKIRFLLYKHYYKRLGCHLQFFIGANQFGKGLHIVHPGFIRTGDSLLCGDNCTVLPRVLIGKKHPGIQSPCVHIGDNCYIGTGATILGPVKIGNNVTIAAGAVVLNDVPDNAIVGGVPAKVLKMRDITSTQTIHPLQNIEKNSDIRGGYVKRLKRYEAICKRKNKSLLHKFKYLCWKHYMKRQQRKTGLYIGTNIFEDGLTIQSYGYIWIDGSTVAGKNCTLNANTLFGKKCPGLSTPNIYVGDNCWFGRNVTVLGPVKIGNNVIVLDGSVVIKDIPDNAIVAGVPAKVIKEGEIAY